MSKQGYIFFGTDDTGKVQNIENAYALSLSLKLADPTRETCVVVYNFNQVPKKYEKGFDYIVELPFGRTESNHHNIFIDFWQLIHCTPFDQTMFIDTYSLAVDNIKSLWEYATLSDISFANSLDFRHGIARDTKLFQLQIRNKIDAFTSHVLIFSKNQRSLEFFKMADPVFKHWREIYRELLDESRPNDFDFTLTINLLHHMLGEQRVEILEFDYIDLELDFLFDPEKEEVDNWLDNLNVWYSNDLSLKINNYRQTGLVRYGRRNFLTEDMIQKLNDNYRKSTAKIQA